MTESEKQELEDERERLLGSLLEFTQIFYKLRTGRKFNLSCPPGRESHYITICRELVKVFYGETGNLAIHVPPRYGKTELVIEFVAWALAWYPDCNFLYTSYSHSLATKQTKTVRSIMQMPDYQNLFGVRLSDTTQSKDDFETTAGGSVYAAGAGGTITGRGAGIQGCPRFGGAIIMDDMHKPSEVTSDTMRESIIDWYYNTLKSRLNSPTTPIIFIGQRLHEHDLPAELIKSGEFKVISLPALDENNNPLNPDMHSLQTLLKMKEDMPYEFSAQYQQRPVPAGGALFKPEWFPVIDEPNVISSFLTIDTAETDKNYNDATVFSFWGLYKLSFRHEEIDMYGLHLIDCREIRVEAADLEERLLDFYVGCLRYKVPPKFVAIEKKSTGVTLSSSLKKMQGIHILDIERTAVSGNKAKRFIEMQPYISRGQVSLPKFGKHNAMFLDHMKSITANDTHAHDDICDCTYDSVKIALIDKAAMLYVKQNDTKHEEIAATIMGQFNRTQAIRRNRG
jgi:predicted phage terminase large subunit-like protein